MAREGELCMFEYAFLNVEMGIRFVEVRVKRTNKFSSLSCVLRELIAARVRRFGEEGVCRK
jgi:hypothetical protein